MPDREEVQRRREVILALTDDMDAEDKGHIISSLQVQLGEYLEAQGFPRDPYPEPPRRDVDALMREQVEIIRRKAESELPHSQP